MKSAPHQGTTFTIYLSQFDAATLRTNLAHVLDRVKTLGGDGNDFEISGWRRISFAEQ